MGNNEKVYCYECKYSHRYWDYPLECNLTKRVIKTNEDEYIKRKLCEKLNKNNDCIYYEKEKSVIELLAGIVICALAVFGIKIKNKVASNDKVDVLAKSLNKKIVEVPAHYKVEDVN